MAGASDPYYVVRDDIQDSLDKAQAKFARWQGMSKASPQAPALGNDVEDECHSIQWQVEEIEKAVDVAERNMARFNISQAEIVSRRKWVHNSRRQIETMLTALDAAKQIAAKRQTNGGDIASPTHKLNSAIRRENDEFLEQESDQQALLIRQQDEELDVLGEHVNRIGRMGKQMHDELQHQSILLEELEEDLEGTQTRLQAAQKKMHNVLAKAGIKGQLGIMAFLLLLLVILIYLAFS